MSCQPISPSLSTTNQPYLRTPHHTSTFVTARAPRTGSYHRVWSNADQGAIFPTRTGAAQRQTRAMATDNRTRHPAPHTIRRKSTRPTNRRTGCGTVVPAHITRVRTGAGRRAPRCPTSSHPLSRRPGRFSSHVRGLLHESGLVRLICIRWNVKANKRSKCVW
jgi:hypothetical protein